MTIEYPRSMHFIVKNDNRGRNDIGENSCKNEKYIQFEQNKQFAHIKQEQKFKYH